MFRGVGVSLFASLLGVAMCTDLEVEKGYRSFFVALGVGVFSRGRLRRDVL